MDIFQIPRNLIYEARNSIFEFGVRDGRSVDSFLFQDMVSRRCKYKVVDLFNDAYYICTLVMIDSTPDEHIREYEKIVLQNYSYIGREYYRNRMRLVLGMVYVYLKCINSAQDVKLRRFRRKLQESADIEFAIKFSYEIDVTIPDSLFSPRKLTRELLDTIDWSTLTNGYNLDVILKMLNLFGKNTSERIMVFDAILRAAQAMEKSSSKQFEKIMELKATRSRLSDPRYSFRDDEDDRNVDTQITERVNDISEKIGEATIPLKLLVEGVKKRVQLKGLEAAIELFENLNNILYSVPEWGKNVPELEKFFIEAREKREAKARGVLMTGDYATYNENNK